MSGAPDLNDRHKAGQLPADPKASATPMNAKAREKLPATQRYGLLSEADLLLLVYEELRKPRARGGVPTGNEDIDHAIGGFRPGNITVLGGKRSFGKTSYSIMAASLAMQFGYNVALFAGEDSAMMYGQRFMAKRARINALRLRDFDTNLEERGRAAKAVTEALKKPFFVRVNGRPVEWIASALRELRKEEPVNMAIVDYLQCIKCAKQQDRRNDVTYITKSLVDAIRDIGAAGLLLSQLRRGDYEVPELEHLKESGDIEDMADHVLLGYRTKDNERRVIIAKNKDGPTDMDHIVLPFDNETASFTPTMRTWNENYTDTGDDRHP